MRRDLFSLLGIELLLSAQKVDENDLKDGFRLEPTNIKLSKNDSNIYCNLYRNGKKVNNNLFRKGGLSSGFKDGYCKLILYTKDETFGKHVIIDNKGTIVFKQENTLDYIYHLKGCIATYGKIFINLKTGKTIVEGDNSIESENYLFVQNKYNDKFEKGVYKINFKTGNYKIIR